VSDEWTAYQNLNTLGYNHDTVNHSKNFVNPSTGANTQQTIECLWSILKMKILRKMHETNRHMLNGHLIEAWYRSVHKSDDFFIDFMKDICKVYS